jgi:hypothetical protein
MDDDNRIRELTFCPSGPGKKALKFLRHLCTNHYRVYEGQNLNFCYFNCGDIFSGM